MPFRKERDKNGTNTIILSNKYCKNNIRSNKEKSTNRDIQKSNRNTNKNTKTNNHKTKRYRYNHSIPSHRKGHAVHNTKNMRKFNICI